MYSLVIETLKVVVFLTCSTITLPAIRSTRSSSLYSTALLQVAEPGFNTIIFGLFWRGSGFGYHADQVRHQAICEIAGQIERDKERARGELLSPAL